MIPTETIIDPIEIYGRSCAGYTRDMDKVTIRSHRDRKDLVVLDHHGIKLTVVAEQLIVAIQNAQNAHE